MTDYSGHSQRIAKNTMMLYIRMFVLMLVGLYTSRVVLDALGESDFGIYNVVGGVVSMFAILSGSLSSAISRFITVELGKGADGNLKSVFSTSVLIQTVLALIVIIIAEPVGLWFIDNKMVIDSSRIGAAHLVLHFSILTFAVNLISIPYNAAIVAYEKMGAFAYISIFEGVAKLAVAVFLAHSSSDRLSLYAILMFAVAISVRLVYGVYCHRKLQDCRFSLKSDKSLLKEMSSFAGWNTIGVASSVCRDHGVNILLNLFFGPAVNAARAISTQVNGVAYNFVKSFTTAVNPQITKSYTSGEYDYMYRLVHNGARFSYYILLFICVPLILKTDYVLGLWLKEVPEYTSAFVRWTLAYLMCESLSHPLVTTQLATGKIRDYQIVVGGLQMLNLPVAYLLLKLGCTPVSVMIAAFVLSLVCLFVRLYMLYRMIAMNVREYIFRVFANVLIVTVLSMLVPALASFWLPDSLLGFAILFIICLVSISVSVLFVGCSKDERLIIYYKVKNIFAGGNA